MAKNLSQLPPATSINDEDITLVHQDGSDFKVQLSVIREHEHTSFSQDLIFNGQENIANTKAISFLKNEAADGSGDILIKTTSLSDNIISIQRYGVNHTVLSIDSPPAVNWAGGLVNGEYEREATVGLVAHNSYGSQTLDVYNMSYNVEPQFGIRMMKSSTADTLKDFVIDYKDQQSGEKTEILRISPQQTIEVSSKIIPEMTGATGSVSTRDIGTSTQKFNTIYANEINGIASAANGIQAVGPEGTFYVQIRYGNWSSNTSGTQQVLFTSSFPTTCLNVIVNSSGTVTDKTANGFTFDRLDEITDGVFEYIAIGY